MARKIINGIRGPSERRLQTGSDLVLYLWSG